MEIKCWWVDRWVFHYDKYTAKYLFNTLINNNDYQNNKNTMDLHMTICKSIFGSEDVMILKVDV